MLTTPLSRASIGLYIGEKRSAIADAKLRWLSGSTAGQVRKWVARLQRFFDVISIRQRPWFAVIAPPSPSLHTLSRNASPETTVFSSNIHVTHPRLSFTFETDTRNSIQCSEQLSPFTAQIEMQSGTFPSVSRKVRTGVLFLLCLRRVCFHLGVL